MSVYPIGTVLAQKIYEPNSIQWYKDQMYTVINYDPIKMQYMIRGTQDNYPRFYTQTMLDITFNIKYYSRGR